MPKYGAFFSKCFLYRVQWASKKAEQQTIVGSRAEKDHRRRVGKNWVMMGFWRKKYENQSLKYQRSLSVTCLLKYFESHLESKQNKERIQQKLTFRYSTGLVTLNLSIVEIMMAGVVRKKRRRKRTVLMIKHLIHQENPPTDRCSLWENSSQWTLSSGVPQLRPQLASKLILQLRDTQAEF